MDTQSEWTEELERERREDPAKPLNNLTPDIERDMEVQS